MKFQTILHWLVRLIPAVIFIQTLFFKFTGAPEPIFIFETLGMEPIGRFGTGIIELISAVMLLIPRTSGIGAAIGLGMMSGALFFHFTKLGIEVQGDGGALFTMGIISFICCAIVLWQERKAVPILKNLMK